MALSNSERQARWRERLKNAAATDHLVLLNVNRGTSSHFQEPYKLETLPTIGDQLVLDLSHGHIDVKVVARRFLNPGTPDKSIVLDCEGEYKSYGAE